MHQYPSLGIASMLQRKGNPIYLVPVLLQKLPEVSVWSQIRLRGFTLDYISGFIPLAFSSPKGSTRQWGYLPIVGVWFLQWFCHFNNVFHARGSPFATVPVSLTSTCSWYGKCCCPLPCLFDPREVFYFPPTSHFWGAFPYLPPEDTCARGTRLPHTIVILCV